MYLILLWREWHCARSRNTIGKATVPAKPGWYCNLPHILQELRTDPRPCVARAQLQLLLGVSRRRAQQILARCVVDRIGTSGLADRDSLITHLERIAAGEDTAYEIQRRRQVASLIVTLRQQRLLQPQLPSARAKSDPPLLSKSDPVNLM